jgi:hypothetical protein
MTFDGGRLDQWYSSLSMEIKWIIHTGEVSLQPVLGAMGYDIAKMGSPCWHKFDGI